MVENIPLHVELNVATEQELRDGNKQVEVDSCCQKVEIVPIRKVANHFYCFLFSVKRTESKLEVWITKVWAVI